MYIMCTHVCNLCITMYNMCACIYFDTCNETTPRVKHFSSFSYDCMACPHHPYTESLPTLCNIIFKWEGMAITMQELEVVYVFLSIEITETACELDSSWNEHQLTLRKKATFPNF